MRHLLLSATALSALMAAPALAQSSTATVNANGTINAGCSALTIASNFVLNDMGAAGSVGVLNASVFSGASALASSNITCNGVGTTLGIESTPVQLTTVANRIAENSPEALAGFSSRVDYTATVERPVGTYVGLLSSSPVTTVGTVGSDASAASGASTVTPGLIAGPLNIKLGSAAIGAGGTTLVAGAYSGSVTLTLTPAT
jgi:hypothetical protein